MKRESHARRPVDPLKSAHALLLTALRSLEVDAPQAAAAAARDAARTLDSIGQPDEVPEPACAALAASGIGSLQWADRYEDPAAQVIIGTWTVLGVDQHVWLIRVHDIDDCQIAVCDPHHRYTTWGDQRCVTMEIPGLDGTWVLFTEPHGE